MEKSEIEILSIKRVPRWKFWKIDNWEVRVRMDGKEKTMTIFKEPPCYPIEEKFLLTDFLVYVKCKALHGTQWIHKINREPRYRAMEQKLQELVGKKVKVEEAI